MPTFAPSVPTSQPVMVKYCKSCGQVVPNDLTAGDHCPHCGVYIAYDETNGKTAHWGAYQYGGAAGTGTLIAFAIAVVVRLVRAAR